MKVYFLSIILFVTLGFSISLNSIEVTIYPEYYYPGVMVQVKGEANENLIGNSFDFLVPSKIDSAFLFQSLTEKEPNFLNLRSYEKSDEHWVQIPITQNRFAFFIFFNPFNPSNNNRSFQFKLKTSIDIQNTHVTFQEPLESENFQISVPNFTQVTDQHGFIFNELHLSRLDAFTDTLFEISYYKSTFETSMELLTSLLNNREIPTSERGTINQNKIPLRHRLPLWEPLLVLGGLSIIIGIMYIQSNKINNSQLNKFCSKCGNRLLHKDLFCSQCGRRKK